MLRLIRAERGRKGIWRTYQHAKLGEIDVITMHGKNGAADVIHIQRASGRQLSAERRRRQG